MEKYSNIYSNKLVLLNLNIEYILIFFVLCRKYCYIFYKLGQR
jgi:hypothetical protein